MHAVDDLPHQRLWTECACHDAGPERAQIESIELRILELRHEHRGHTVKRGAALALDRFENAAGIERLERAQTRAMRERAEHANDAAEAVKERHAQTQGIRRREAEALSEHV